MWPINFLAVSQNLSTLGIKSPTRWSLGFSDVRSQVVLFVVDLYDNSMKEQSRHALLHDLNLRQNLQTGVSSATFHLNTSSVTLIFRS